MRKIIFLFTSFSLVLFLLVLFIAVSFFQKDSFIPSIPPVPTKIPAPLPTSNTEPAVNYNLKKANELVEKAKKRTQLSDSGRAAKESLILSLGSTSGIIYNSQLVTIEYIKSPDLFQAMIKTKNIQEGKNNAESFMASKGFTKEDLCNLPFSYYLNPAVIREMKGTKLNFNPLPEGC